MQRIYDPAKYKFTYGSETLIRDNLLIDTIITYANKKQFAGSDQHPAARMFTEFWNALTIAEIEILVYIFPELKRA